jgi:hypothetical protein
VKDRNLALLSFQRIEATDLRRLLDLAITDREVFFQEYPDWAESYSNRVLGTALCQGAALHYVRPDHGINDFDIYTFYAAHPKRRWYAKRIKQVDFGDAKFGRSELTKQGFIGRRVDLMGRDLPVPPGTPLPDALLHYLTGGKTRTARELASKPVILLEPAEEMGMVVWSGKCLREFTR